MSVLSWARISKTGLAVAAGIADVALGLRSAADELTLDFVRVTWEAYDLVVAATALPAAQPLVMALTDDSVTTSITALGGYDLTEAGQVLRLT